MSSDEIKPLRKIQAYLAEWLAKFRKAQELVPFVQRNLEITEWELNVFENSPAESDEIARPDLTEAYEQRLIHIESAIPDLPEFDPSQFVSTLAYTTSSSSDVFTYVSRVGDLDTPDAVDFSRQYTAEYDQIQKKQDREAEVGKLIIERTSPGSHERFERAKVALAAERAQVAERTATGNEVRNLLLGLKGDLFEKARKWDKENMTWPVMARRLAKGGEDSDEATELTNQGHVHAALLDRLASVAKDREVGSLTNLDFIWTETLDHLFVVLSFIED